MVELIKEFKIKFRGIRGSYPVSAADKLNYGGNTSCVEVHANGHTIILDAGTGIIELGNDLLKAHIASGTDAKNRKPVETLVLFSHAHMDHLQGLPFFKPCYIKSSKLNLFGASIQGKDFSKVLSDTVFEVMFPVGIDEAGADIKINNIKETEAIILNPGIHEPEVVRYNSEDEIFAGENAVVITCMKSPAHPKDGVMLYKIKCNGKTVVYATDKESYVGGDVHAVNFARGANLLIHDAQYKMEDYISPVFPRQGFGHSTIEMAIETAKLANVSQLALFHLDPSYDDDLLERLEEKTRGMLSNSLIARENFEIDLMQVKCKV